MHGNSYIVESHHGNVLRNLKSGLLKCANRANRGDVVVGKKRRERPLARQQFFGEWKAELRCSFVAFELKDQLRTHADAKLFGNVADGVPAVFRIGAEF